MPRWRSAAWSSTAHGRAGGGSPPGPGPRPRRSRRVADLDSRLALLLALADDELVIGHRHAGGPGGAPSRGEARAFPSIGQDEMGHARALYGLAEPLAGKDPDAL